MVSAADDFNDVAVVAIVLVAVCLALFISWCVYGYWVSGGRDCAGGFGE